MASTVDAKLLRQTKFPLEFNQRVDMKKVNIEVMKKWIASKISEILGNEDDVVIELCFNLLEDSRYPDIKALQISLTGFLDKDTPKFCRELWNLCLSAQSNPQGVPKELLEAKKLELLQEKLDAEKAVEETRRRKERDSIRDREVDTIRQRERAERGRGRGAGGRGARPFESRRPRDPSSPPPYRRGSPPRGSVSRREVDTYIPRARGDQRPIQRDRSWTRSSTESFSRSPTPSSPGRLRHPRRYRSRTRSPPRPNRSRRSLSRSVSSPRRAFRRRRGSVSRGDRSRSDSYSEYSRSRSPRRRRRSSTPPSPSVSPSFKPRYRHRKRETPSYSRSRSTSRGRYGRRSGRSRRSKRSTSFNSQDGKRVARADISKDHTMPDGRRLSRSRDRYRHQPRRSRTRSRNRKRSHSVRREQKRRRSLERWAPAARRRRNTSSVTSPDDKRRKIADGFADEDRPGLPPSRGQKDDNKVKEGDKEAQQSSSQQHTTVPVPVRSLSKLSANEFREKLLREKIRASRKQPSTERQFN